MTLQQIKDFIAVVECGGFRAAARNRNVSQGGLTKSLAKLENEYGVVLLSRGAKELSLTPAGEEFLHLARATLLEADRARNWLLHSGAQREAFISLGISVDPALRVAPAVINDFKYRNPAVSLQITHSVTNDLLALLRDNRIELALARVPSEMDSGDLKIEVLYQASPAVMVRTGHPLAKARSVLELLQCEWIVVGSPPVDGMADPALTELFDNVQLGRPNIATYYSSLFDAVSRLMVSDCVARLPSSTLDHPLIAGKLLPLQLTTPPCLYQIGIIRKTGRQLSKEAETLAAMICSYARAKANTWGPVL